MENQYARIDGSSRTSSDESASELIDYSENDAIYDDIFITQKDKENNIEIVQKNEEIEWFSDESRSFEIEQEILTTDSKKKTESFTTNSLRSSVILNLQRNSIGMKHKFKSKNLIKDRIDHAIKEGNKLIDLKTPDIGFYGLPHEVKQLLAFHQGITELFAWQDECLRLPSVVNHENLIISLPTSGGKTLVAEILVLKELLCRNRDAILILPYVAIVQEKVREMSPLAIALDFVVEEYAGDKGTFPPKTKRKRRTIFMATIEKGHGLINSLIENERLNEIGLIVVDELHMLGENGGRGGTLENLLTKVLFTEEKIQIIGMSATLGNISDITKFLKAHVYQGNFRPVELQEYVKLENDIFKVDPKSVDLDKKFIFSRKCKFNYPQALRNRDPDQLFGLVAEVCPQNSCLVFCATKKNCENVATVLCRGIHSTQKYRDMLNFKSDEKAALLAALTADGNGRLCHVLQKTIPYGIAYHHSGLTMDERRHLEEAYSNGVLCCLTCTSTLAAGVNLPAKRVIIRSPYVGISFINRSKYKQMIGRAGRTGIDSSGDSILIIKAGEQRKVADLLASPEEECWSSLLTDNDRGLKGLILSLVGLQIVKTISNIDRFLSLTLLSVQRSHFNVDVEMMRTNAIRSLIAAGLVKATYDGTNHEIENAVLKVSDLGRATFKGCIDVDIVSQLDKDLNNGLDGLSLYNHLHLLYLVTPYDAVATIQQKKEVYYDKFMNFSFEDSKVASMIGIKTSDIVRIAKGESVKNEKLTKRFYVALILYELWCQRNIWEVSSEFELHRGTVQNLLTNTISFASCVNHFCKELPKFWAYEKLLVNFVKQLSYCVTAELLPLMELPAVKRGRASQLYKNGFKTLQDIAKSNVNEIVQAVPFIPRKVATQIIAAAQMILVNKLEELKTAADELVEVLHFPPVEDGEV